MACAIFEMSIAESAREWPNQANFIRIDLNSDEAFVGFRSPFFLEEKNSDQIYNRCPCHPNFWILGMRQAGRLPRIFQTWCEFH